MAVIEPKQEEFSYKPIVFLGVLFLLLVGIGFGIYKMLGNRQPRSIKLSTADAQQVANVSSDNSVPPGPPFPAMGALPAADNPAPTRITLDLKNATVQQIAEAIGKQAGATIEVPRNGGGGVMATIFAKRMDFAITDATFWAAMSELTAKGNVYLMPYGQRDERGVPTTQRIVLQSGTDGSNVGPTQDIGACRLVLNNVISRFDADVLTGQPSRQLTVGMTLYVEPKLKAYRISPIATIEQAVDEKGNSLVRPRDPWDDRNSGMPRSKVAGRVEAKLKFADSAGDKITRLKGYASVITVGKDETVVIKDPLKLTNFDQKIDGQTIRLRKIYKQGNNDYRAQFTVDANSPLFREWESLSSVATMVDANGKELRRNGTGMGGGQKTMDFYLYFSRQDAGEPTELRLTVPTQVKEVRIPFDFTDLPLPH